MPLNKIKIDTIVTGTKSILLFFVFLTFISVTFIELDFVWTAVPDTLWSVDRLTHLYTSNPISLDSRILDVTEGFKLPYVDIPVKSREKRWIVN